MQEAFDNIDLKDIEYLLIQSIKGQHLAFDSVSIKDALSAPLNGILRFECENRAKVQELFMEFIQYGSLKKKQIFINSLHQIDKELLIKAYFHIVENTIKKCGYTH